MATVKLHTEFQSNFNLDHGELTFLSALYYQQIENDRNPVSLTQDHITNLTGLGKYSQRRIRKSLAAKKLMADRIVMKLVDDGEGKNHRKTIVYTANLTKLDALLAEVEYRASERQSATVEPIDTTTHKPAFKPELAVKMNAEWLPDAAQLESYLTAYGIDPRFATHDVLPEFIAFWSNTEFSCLPAKWQTKFHAQVSKQWDFEVKRQHRAAMIHAASDKKAAALVALKEKQTRALMVAASEKLNTQHNVRRQPTTLELMDTSFADKYDFDFDA